ncbi:hypothetical protein LWI29_004030 [Acer saccharum]|uniref:ABC transporter domain-containing protein n=1 Tax=Acer saccharum TaxID=4024 RepID=A0AA39RBV5_ACESA|nr:hypothetical protein LWI29_004030 [Acer saccharum]
METGDVLRPSSARLSSSNIWRNDPVEVFSRSSRGNEEDDEDALKWAALEKLPTYLRIQRGILTEAEGPTREIDIKSLGWIERRNLIERLVKIAEEDNEKFLLKLKERIDRVGLDLPTIEVRFNHLNIEAEAYVGGRALPTIFNFCANIFEGFLNFLHILPSRKKPLPILHDVSGIIKPRRMTLLLGPPSSGKTTLLLTLAGKLGKDLKFSGKVTYNGHGMEEFVPQRTSAYISQYDLHIGEMTVRETLSFSARCQGVGPRYEMLAELARREKSANIKPDPDLDLYMKAASLEGQETNVVTDYILKILGLEICADTLVGDEMLRGISGGQKKRVTTGEMMVGPARAFFMDEISTGLDSSTTFQIVNSLRQSIHILNGTAVISLLQPAPETYQLFDDIILLSDGQIIYQGPRENVLEFFEHMGFKCPERKGVADFLQELFVAAFVTMTLFLRTEMHRNTVTDGGIYLGAMFFTMIMIMFNGFSELSMSIMKLPVFYKQRDLLFYPAWAYSLPTWILKIPITFLEVGVWVFMTYYVIGYDPNIERSVTYSRIRVSIPPNSNESLGVTFMKSRGLFPQAYWYWIGVGATIGYVFLFNFLFAVALKYLDPLGKPQSVLSEEALADKTAYKTGDSVELSSREKSLERGNESRRSTISSRTLSARVGGFSEASETRKRGMILPFEPHSITFDEIRYTIDMPRMFVEEVMELVELNPIRGALVGLPGVNGLSTEQRKRLTIAVELVANPSIIFMDEPTSGLDARAAAIVMRTVRNTVDTGRTVVCTIHQPSIDIFDAFDELLLLKRGGEEIYVGPLGRYSSQLIEYFEGIEGVPKIRDGYNPATWMLEITTTAQEVALGINFTDVYKNSELCRRNKELIKELSTSPPGSKELYFGTKYSQSFFNQCMACLWKQHLSYWRNPPYTAVRLLFTTFIALMFGTIFWDIGSIRYAADQNNAKILPYTHLYVPYSCTIFGTCRTKKQDLFNAMGSMYAAILFIGVQNATSVQPVVSIERTVFYRERAAGMYSALPYAFGQVVIEIPHVFVQTVIYGVIVYAMIGFEWTASKFFWYLFFMYFTLLYFTFYGMMSVAFTPDHNVAGIVSSFFYFLWNLFSGFIIPRTRIPVWWRWFYWVCPISWTLYGLVATQFGDIEDTLDTGEKVSDFVRDYLGYDTDFVGVVAVVMVGMTVVFAITFAYSIKAFNFQKR